MEFYDAVYQAAWQNGLTMEQLSQKLGHTATYITSAKSRGSLPKVNNAAKILDACEYTLCAVPKGSVPDDAITINF